MPELPEVETIATQLNEKLVGKALSDVDIISPKSFIGDIKLIIDQKIVSVSRRAKVIRISFENGYNVLFHLKMTGQLIYLDYGIRLAGGHPSHDWHEKLPNSHTRIVFEFGENEKLFFNDMRKFGWAKVLSDAELMDYFLRYGPEPLNGLETDKLLELASKRPKIVIKKFIMDQSVIAGVGNIYADEALFATRLHPLRLASSLNNEEWVKLTDNIVKILNFAVIQGGTTDSDYVDSEGKSGGMQNYLNVYRKNGSKCTNNCGGVIEKIVVGGRGTHFCPRCQENK